MAFPVFSAGIFRRWRMRLDEWLGTDIAGGGRRCSPSGAGNTGWCGLTRHGVLSARNKSLRRLLIAGIHGPRGAFGQHQQTEDDQKQRPALMPAQNVPLVEQSEYADKYEKHCATQTANLIPAVHRTPPAGGIWLR